MRALGRHPCSGAVLPLGPPACLLAWCSSSCCCACCALFMQMACGQAPLLRATSTCVPKERCPAVCHVVSCQAAPWAHVFSTGHVKNLAQRLLMYTRLAVMVYCAWRIRGLQLRQRKLGPVHAASWRRTSCLECMPHQGVEKVWRHVVLCCCSGSSKRAGPGASWRQRCMLLLAIWCPAPQMMMTGILSACYLASSGILSASSSMHLFPCCSAGCLNSCAFQAGALRCCSACGSVVLVVLQCSAVGLAACVVLLCCAAMP